MPIPLLTFDIYTIYFRKISDVIISKVDPGTARKQGLSIVFGSTDVVRTPRIIAFRADNSMHYRYE